MGEHDSVGNIKNALCGTYHAVRPKYAQRYLAEFEYRFIRRFDLPDIIPRLVYVRRCEPRRCRNGCSSYAWLEW